MSDTVIRVEGLSKYYRIGLSKRADTLGEHLAAKFRRGSPERMSPPEHNDFIWALKDVSFEVKQGEVLGIIGPNGAGKSTLLKILTRITAPTSGSAFIRGRVGSLLEVGTGFHPELTGRENIFLNGAILGMTRAEISRKLNEIIAFSGVEKFIDTPVKRYSSGMYVRLAFAVAAHLDPEILFVDEVLAVGDAAFQKKSMGKMEDASRQGRTILFVSHGMASVKSLCTKAILLMDGHVATEGDTHRVVSSYLEQGLQQEDAFLVFEDNPNVPFYVRRVAVTNEAGLPNRQFHLSTPIFVEIDYVATKAIKGGMVIFAVSRDGTFVFQSHDTDLRPGLLDHREAGVYRARVPLPKRLLTAGSYSLSFTAAIGPQGRDGHDGHLSALSFVIDEEDEDVSTKSYAGYRNNLVITELDWQIDRTD